MSNDVLVVIQPRRGEVLDSSLAATGAGVELKALRGGKLTLGVLGHDAASVAGRLRLAGVDELVAVPMAEDGFDPEAHESAVHLLIEETGAGVVLFGHGVDAMGVAPAVAASGSHGLVTDVIALGVVDGQVRATRSSFADQLLEELDCPDKALVLTIRAGSFSTPDASAPSGPHVRVLSVPASPGRVKHLRWVDPTTEGVDITKAPLLVSVGRPIGSADNVARVDKLATAMGGLMSASRPVVDAGWAEPARQVGQTGRTVKPKVYLALGISGAIQHIAGMSGSELVIAVNTDPAAPITEYASYVADIDLLQLVQALENAVGL